MRATNGPVHKALVEVAGVPLLEYNLLALFLSGIDEIVVVISKSEPAIGHYISSRGTALARQFSGRITTFIETEPLGNIGAVGAVTDGLRDMIVLFADNLTSIALPDLLARHRETAASLTVATHVWELRNPFGELEIDRGHVRSYQEKPVRKVRVSSGLFVVGHAAAALIPARRPVGAAEFFDTVLAAGLSVAAYEHNANWIDVNDADALARADRLVRSGAIGIAS